MNLQFKPSPAERMERCVLCGRVTDVPVSCPVTARTHYVDGAGELCPACFAEVYGVSELRWISEPAAL